MKKRVLKGRAFFVRFSESLRPDRLNAAPESGIMKVYQAIYHYCSESGGKPYEII